ncbi:LysE family translocator [Actinomadura citrea]|uniref:Threonine/homoserine/homoserine lactone efflux protein n=1 Tax=Actinomadura citrea TaxID=46158 RepID=A0A7Y9KFU0_9ACTN|nr:LysE family translocator [Actinomadura citrea]NYE17737.1 threonine/homoserine/homoserine lactone efflux protein [Actinomadura citrea]GGT61257.1 lysine transporter LysE [Actinomadura citrea]
MQSSILTFALAALVLIMIPGPDQALVTRSTLAGGRAAGLLTTVGGVAGLAVHAGAAALGLSALLLASATAFAALKIVGAAYLLWMAVQTLRSAARSRREPEAAPVERAGRPGRPRRRPMSALGQGFLSNALNPKVALFFVTFLPQFLSAESAGAARGRALLLSAVFALLYLVWFGLYVAVVDGFGRLLRRPRVKAGIERVTGVLLIGFAVKLATARQSS